MVFRLATNLMDTAKSVIFEVIKILAIIQGNPGAYNFYNIFCNLVKFLVLFTFSEVTSKWKKIILLHFIRLLH